MPEAVIAVPGHPGESLDGNTLPEMLVHEVHRIFEAASARPDMLVQTDQTVDLGGQFGDQKVQHFEEIFLLLGKFMLHAEHQLPDRMLLIILKHLVQMADRSVLPAVEADEQQLGAD
ncbi:hypothetical protein D3C71_1706540 [compost metagenome]